MTVLPLPLGEHQVQYVVDGRLVPLQFPYLAVLLQGRPSPGHPTMERGKRAKLFAPFDALDGYGEHLSGKHAVYTDRVTLDEEDQAELNRRLTILRDLTKNARLAKAAAVRVTAVYYVPCRDPQSFSFGVRGQYVTVSGTVKKIDAEITRTLTVDDAAIPLDDLKSLRAEKEELFAPPQEE